MEANLKHKYGKLIQDIINNYSFKYPVVTMNNPFIVWAAKRKYVRIISATQQEWTPEGINYFHNSQK